MRASRLILIALATLCLGGGAAVWSGAVPALGDSPSASPSPSPSASCSQSATPTPSPSASPAPVAAPAKLVSWACKWAKLAARHRARVDRLRRCLGRRALRPLPARPDRAGESALWTAYGKHCRKLARVWWRESRVDYRRIVAPSPLRSASQWRPLLLYVGWPSSALDDAVTCIRRESGGRPWAYNPSGCAGLFQLAGCWWAGRFDPYSPLPNARTALAIWRREGWRPWTSMPEFW